MNITALVSAGLDGSTPLLLASLGGVMAERSGVSMIGIEGLMLGGAFGAALGSYFTSSALAGAAVGAAAGLSLAALFAWIAVALRADQIVAGIGINLLALGVTSVGYRALFGETGRSFTVEGIDRMPVAGQLSVSPLLIAGLCSVALVQAFLARTRIGLALRASGEMPEAVEAAGMSVVKLRVFSVLFAGLLCGLAGTELALSQAHTFVEGMTAGRGFLCIAIVVFGSWKPLGALAGSLLFGLLNTLQFHLQATGIALPYHYLLMLPYVLSLALLAGLGLRARPPASLGVAAGSDSAA